MLLQLACNLLLCCWRADRFTGCQVTTCNRELETSRAADEVKCFTTRSSLEQPYASVSYFIWPIITPALPLTRQLCLTFVLLFALYPSLSLSAHPFPFPSINLNDFSSCVFFSSFLLALSTSSVLLSSFIPSFSLVLLSLSPCFPTATSDQTLRFMPPLGDKAYHPLFFCLSPPPFPPSQSALLFCLASDCLSVLLIPL